jgi:UDP-glucose 4-epimerase
MQKILHLYRTEKVLFISGILFVVMVGGVLAMGLGDDYPDADGDTVADNVDQCQYTAVDRPTDEPNKKDKDKVQSEFSMADTRGCSCSDIIKMVSKTQDTSGDSKFGCSKGTIQSWLNNVSQ